MINAQENACAPLNGEYIRDMPRKNSDVIFELAGERGQISDRLARLKKAIAADPQAVSEHHKNLWVKQVKAMQAYVDVLSERIKDLLDSDT